MAVEQVTLEQMIEEVEREIRLREKVYPRWIEPPHPRLSATQARIQMERLQAVRDRLVSMLPKNLKVTVRQDPLSQSLNEGDGVYRP